MSSQILHLDTEEARRVANQIGITIDEIRQQTQTIASLIGQLDWSSPGRDQFISDYHHLYVKVSSLLDAGDQLSARMNQTIMKWEEIAAEVTLTVIASFVVAEHGESIGTTRPGYDWLKPNERIVGDPVFLEQYAEKQSGNTCALYAQGMAMRALGYSFDAEETKKLGLDVGYYKLGPIDGSLGLGKVWDHYGVNYSSFSGNSLLPLGNLSSNDYDKASQFLIDNLQSNKAVIVGVEVDTLYNGIAGVQDNYLPLQGHAVWVTGLITSPEGTVTEVIMNDSLAGYSTRVPIRNFMSAWATKNYQAIASDNAMDLK